MRYLGNRQEKHDADHPISVILMVVIIAIGLALGSVVESKAHCGDANYDTKVNIGDVAYLAAYLYRGGSGPIFADSADVDSISGITSHDIQHLLEFLFTGEPQPYCPPYPPDSILPVTTDTLEVRNRTVSPGQGTGKVDLWLQSKDTLQAISFAFQYSCATSSITLDSISFVGTAFSGNVFNEDTVYPGLGMGAIGITSRCNTTPQLTADSGLVAALWFSVTPAAYTQYINIDTTTAPPSNITIFSRRTANTDNKLIAFIPTIVGLSASVVEFVTPPQNALNVGVATDITARFGYDMDPGSIMDTTFVVYGQCSGPHAGMITYDAPTQTASFDPTVDFQPGELVTVILSTGIDYQGGAPMDTGYVWSFTTAVRGGTGQFSPQSTYPVGNEPEILFVSDLDGDGDNDLAVPNANSNSVSVLKNNGNGTFAAATDYGVGTRPNSVWAVDLDKDGDVDLCAANANSNDVSILRNSGSGSFTLIGNYPVATYPSEVSAADLDGDGDVDLMTSNMSDRMAILINQGDASFGAATGVFLSEQTSGIRNTDIDNDGDIDLIGADYYYDEIVMTKNLGDGTFDWWRLSEVGDGPVYIAAADLDGDGDNDLAVANVLSDNISILRNNGDGTFAAAVNYDAGDGPLGMAAADLDADGDIDLAVAIAVSDNIAIFRNNGDGTFAAAVNYGVGDEPLGVSAADLDGDGDNDLAITNYNSDNISILLNQGDFLVQNTNDAGVGSLRWAIQQANTDLGSDTILFDVSGTIALASPLPALIDDSTVILGSSVPGGNWSVILDGTSISGGGDGLVVQSRDNVIEGLTIKNFPGNGITVGGALSIRNRLSHNLISNNNSLGIDLGANGVTLNDIGDGDSGPNDLLNFPVMDSVRIQPDSSFKIFGHVADSGLIIEFYAAHAIGDTARLADPSGHGEAVGWLNTITSRTGGVFDYPVPDTLAPFSILTMTATDSLGNTSEFSENFYLTPQPLIVVAYSPVNIIVTDPDGLKFGRDSLNNDITGIPDGHYFVTPHDSVIIDHPKQGNYIIEFVTEAGTPPGAMYSAIIKIDGTDQVAIAADEYAPISGTLASFTYDVEEEYHYINADANRDATIDVGDAVFIINYVFKGGQEPYPVEAADANCDHVINVGDAVHIINYIFKGGPEPCAFTP